MTPRRQKPSASRSRRHCCCAARVRTGRQWPPDREAYPPSNGTFVRKLEGAGFVYRRQSGRHARYVHPDGRGVTVPMFSRKRDECP
ncbi:MAG: hypothetical protein DMD77_22915 [Candidatus Rokuibacteriota bacterium]|nr:MAG: hypothetical protein DMD77_22915 [Candidatus Rokubacteria bacterium]PYM73216.1 MAG: hypothetical protein DME10_10690 [Candidatus Rokubacteria bacterium]